MHVCRNRLTGETVTRTREQKAKALEELAQAGKEAEEMLATAATAAPLTDQERAALAPDVPDLPAAIAALELPLTVDTSEPLASSDASAVADAPDAVASTATRESGSAPRPS